MDAIREERQRRGQEQRISALADFVEALRLAGDSGLILDRRTDSHYQLSPDTGGETWMINLYPGNGRIYMDRNRPRAPFLKVGKPWTLIDVVKAAATELKGGE